MRDIHEAFTRLKQDYPQVHETQEELGRYIHEEAGLLPEPTRLLAKVAASAAAGHQRALETHLAKAREAGVSEGDLMHALLLLIPTCGFPSFMEAYSTYLGTRWPAAGRA
ncbi:MAG: carboxymuconolactone decarboxylase family protein [Gaiellales bacterium]|nr:carboxymuconolactone decarboxylase family protein [Gaiellales bacterium]